MKTSMMGIVAAAILMVVAGVGFGIAQAGEYRSEQPIISLEGMEAMEAVETGSLPACSYDKTLCFGDNDVNPYIDVGQAVEFCPEDCFTATDWQTRGAVETGAIPEMVPEEDMYRGWGPNEWGYNE